MKEPVKLTGVTPEARFNILTKNIVKQFGNNPYNVILAALGSVMAKVIFFMDKDPKKQWWNYLQLQKAIETSIRLENLTHNNPDPAQYKGFSEAELKPSTIAPASAADVEALARAQKLMDAAAVEPPTGKGSKTN